jgi:long-chain fatty acid transport protein
MRKTPLILALAAIGFTTSAFATDGYFSQGYGMTAKGMGGAATAMASDTFGGANNPASMVWVGNRIDLGADLFSPRREASRTGSTGGAFDGSAKSGMNYFLVPEFGYNRMLNSDLSLGVTVYGNGGMNTDYPTGQLTNAACTGGVVLTGTANLLCGSSNLGVNLMQLIIAPTAAYKVNATNSIGISPLFGYQRFSAKGLQAFSGMSSDSTSLTNNGTDDASGWGVRVGWQGHLTSNVTLGAAYSTKIDMSKFSKYAGLFAEQGDFDIPENYNVGVAFNATPDVKLAVDYQRINYGGVKSIANPSAGLGGAWGMATGPGFGWTDVNVWKLGVEYKMSSAMTVRAGYNHTDNPIQSADTMFNILAPGVIENHVTLGLTYAVNNSSDLTVAYMHAFENSVSGPDGLGAGGTDTIKMHQDALGIAYSWKM